MDHEARLFVLERKLSETKDRLERLERFFEAHRHSTLSDAYLSSTPVLEPRGKVPT